jgi:hypothetical protein
MKQQLTTFDRDYAALEKDDPDYMIKLQAWSLATEQAQQVVWDALCEVLYASHYKMMETIGGYGVDHTAVDRLDAAIETVLEAMPPHAKERFDKLMHRPCAS